MIDKCSQDWFSIASILEDVLTEIKKTNPSILEAFLRSDNAGCYHCAQLILAIPGISKRSGINVKRYDFSDPQAGKDVCDRKIAPMKSQMKRFVNEGHDIVSAADMKSALDSYGGVKGLYVTEVVIETGNMASSKPSWKGILSYNNFEFTKRGIRVWKSYNIGRGKLFTNARLKRMGASQGPTALTTIQEFSRPREEIGALLKSKPAQEEKTTPSLMFNCPEDTCVDVFLDNRSLQHHLDIGKHTTEPHRESTFDSVKRNWAKRCLTVRPLQKDAPVETETLVSHATNTPTCQMGWALKKKRKSTKFSTEVKQFLLNAFWEGQDTGRKHDPKVISTQLRSARSSGGGKMFRNCEDWLTAQQVAAYFSRLSALNKAGKLTRGSVDVDSEEVDQVIEQLQVDDLIASINCDLE